MRSAAGLDGLQPDTLTLCAPLDAPPLLLTQRWPSHTPPVSPGGAERKGRAAHEKKVTRLPLRFKLGSVTELGSVGTEVVVAMGSSAGWTDVDVNRETFEWMRAKRSRRSGGEFEC